MSRHNYSNIAGGYMPRSDNAGGFSIEPTSIEERGNPIADDGGWRPVSTQAQQAASQPGVGDHTAKIRERGLKKYRGVSLSGSGSKWVAAVSNSSSDQKSNRVHLGTFPTAEMAAIAFDTSTLLLRGDSSVQRLNFPRYASQIKNILKGCSSSTSNANLKFVAEKGAQQLGSLMSPEKDRGSKVSSLINVEQKDQGLEVSAPISLQQTDHQGLHFSTAIPAATSTATSLEMSSSKTGMSDSTSNADYPLSGANNKFSAWKGAKDLVPLMSPEKNQGLEVFPLISVEQRDQGLEVSPLVGLDHYQDDEGIEVLAAILADTSTPMTITDMFDSTSNLDFPVVPSHVNQRTEAAACATGSNRRAITSAQQLPTQIPDYQEVSMNNTDNQQIQHLQSRSYMPAAADSVIALSSFEHGPRHEFSTQADTIQDAAIPTSNPDSLPVEMENSAIPTSNPSSSTIQDVAIPTSNPDSMQENRMLMEYPSLRYSPDCVLLKPVPGANTHPDYIWKGYP